jgi:molecular chaperone DnaK
MKLGEAMYQAQQSGGDQSGGDAGSAGGAEGGEKKDDVVDAEFTEVDDKKKSA